MEPPGNSAADFESAPEPVGMQIYWNLSSVDSNVRETAAVALVRELLGAQRNYEDKVYTTPHTRSSGLGQEEKAAEAAILGKAKIEEDGLKDCAPALQYALRRLIRGVASSRESARQGFALALAAVLGALPCINGTAVMKLIQKHLEVASSMKGQEARDTLLGQLFAYAAIVRSSQAIGNSSTSEQQELVKELTQQLLALAKKKTFLREPAMFVQVELGEKLQGAGLEKGVCAAPLFSESLKEDGDNTSPDTLFLVLKLHDKLPKSVLQSCSLIPDSGNLVDIFEEDHLLRIVPCLKESSSSHPRLHSVWDPLLQILFSDTVPSKSNKKNKKRRSSQSEPVLEKRLETFWSIVVDNNLLASSHERKHLAMQLLLLFLPRLPAPSCIRYILSENFVQCLLGACASKENLLYKSAQNCTSEVCKWAEGDDERRISVVIALQQGSQGKFDQLSRTQSVKGLIGGLTTITGYQLTFQALSSLHLSGVASEDVAKSSLRKKKLKPPAEELEDVQRDARDPGQRRWAVDQLRALCQQALVGLPAHSAVGELITKYIPLLTPVQPFTAEEEESIATLQTTMLQVSNALSQVDAGEQKDRLQAVLSLLVQLLFESRLVPSVAVETASEIAICCKKAFGDLVQLEVESDAEDEDAPVFMDVLVDVLLSLLAQPSAPIRAAADQVFKSFSGDLTTSGLTDLLRIVKKNTQRSRHKPVVEVDNQKDDNEDILDLENSDEESMEEDEDGDVEDVADDSGSDGEDSEVPGATEHVELPTTHKQDESKAPEEDDDDEQEGSELDDETMFRMDKHLANILKQRKQGGSNVSEDSKDGQTQLMQFKFRVLALLEIFLQKHSGSTLVLTMLPALLHVFVNSCTTDGNSQVADRVSSILLNKLFKGKHYPKGPGVDQSSLKDLLRKALKLASRSTIKRVRVVAQSTCHWVLKVMLGNSERGKEDKDVEEMFSSGLEDFFVHKKCRLPSSFFRECFTRNTWLGDFLLGSVLEKCTTARSEYLQFEALQLATLILGFKAGKSAKKSKQPLDSSVQCRAVLLKAHLPLLSKVICHGLKVAVSVKATRRVEALQFSVSTLENFQTLYPNECLADFIEPDNLAVALREITAPTKSKIGNLLVKLRRIEEKGRK